MAFGLLSTGFAIKTLDDILADVEAAELDGISPALNMQAPDPIAVVNGALGQQMADLWELGGALHNGMNADGAADDQLTSLALLTGTQRDPATKAIVAATVNVDDSFSQAIGSMFAYIDGNPSLLFTNAEAVSNTSGIPANVAVEFQAVTAGLTGTIASATLTEISTPIVGWNSITNATDGIAGKDVESDSDLRADRETELAASGSTNAAAIRADILRILRTASNPLTIDGIAIGTNFNPFTLVANTESCTVLENTTDYPDANGLPPHSVEAIAYAPGNTTADDYALAALILASKAAGIASYSGNATFKTITDSAGNSQAVYYTRPTGVRFYILITVARDPNIPVTATQVKDALTAFALSVWSPGETLYVLAMKASVLAIPGVLDVTSFTLDIIGVPVNTANYTALTMRQVGTLAAADIGVTVTP